MKKYLASLAVLCPLAFAQLTPEQKLADFRQLASLYAKHYAPYEWKRDVARFDLYEITPWLARVAATRTDLEFYEACVEYVAKLNDGHDFFEIPSDFVATLGFSLDLFDNRPMVYAINRRELPSATYPISIGDELISIDGTGADDLIRSMANYAVAANNRTTARFAASTLTYRLQSQVPHAVDLPDESTVVFRSAEGEMKTMRIPWVKTGAPLRNAGPVPSPKSAEARSSVATPGYLQTGDEPYMLPLRMLANMKARQRPDQMVAGYGSVFPIHRMPEGFTQRLGRSASDSFFSGTFMAGDRKIGFLRIPHFNPSSRGLALTQWITETQYMQGNVDGLILDITRNPGGDACYTEALLSYLIPVPFRGVGVEIRATSFFVMVFSDALEQARAMGAPDSLIDQYAKILAEVQAANSASRGKTGVIGLCGQGLEVQPATDMQGREITYNKPLMLLTDDLSASAADVFAAIIQDTWRGPIFGWRTMGLGGSVGYFPNATTYSEGGAAVTWTQIMRQYPAAAPGYPYTAYIENVGVHPDIEYDSQTRENLLNRYGPYVDAFTNAMLNHIAASR